MNHQTRLDIRVRIHNLETALRYDVQLGRSLQDTSALSSKKDAVMTRTEFVKAALCEAGRPDLADHIHPNRGGNPCIGRVVETIQLMLDDELKLVFRAARLAWLSLDPQGDGYGTETEDGYVDWVRSG